MALLSTFQAFQRIISGIGIRSSVRLILRFACRFYRVFNGCGFVVRYLWGHGFSLGWVNSLNGLHLDDVLVVCLSICFSILKTN